LGILNCENSTIEEKQAAIRQFETGATRDTDTNKYDYEGFFHPLVMQRYAEYMHKHRVQKDGSLRDSDNWTKGIPRRQYVKSLMRHMMDVWLLSRGYPEKAIEKDLTEALTAVLFNVMGLLHEALINRNVK
jgi:hypothetical protein